MTPVSVHLPRRLRTFIASRPPATRLVVAACLDNEWTRAAPRDTERYWLLLPQWLDSRVRHPGPRTLNDILWAQYCLFAFVSMQDEVLDSESSSPNALFAAYEFLTEAERVLARHLIETRFWHFYRESLARTARGILTANAIQRGGPASIEPLLSSYAAQASIFKIGSAALCLPHRAGAVLRRCSRFADHLAIAGQLLDDLEDVRDDLADGRLNAAARFLVPEADPRTPDLEQRIARALVLGDTLTALLGRIRGHVRAAATAIAPLALPQADAYAEAIRADLDRVEASLNRGRVAAVFGPLLAAQ